MNKIAVSVGVVALSASALQSVSAQETIDIPKPPKPWSISATLRGFYDDNPSTLPDNDPNKHDSFGFEVSPTASFVWNVEQTSVSLGYLYSFKYYDHIPFGNSDHNNQTHTFNLSLDHAFSERYKIAVKDSFAIGQEPDILRSPGSTTIGTPFYVSGDNIRNYGAIVFDGNLTREFGFEVGYDNTLYKYSDTSVNFDTLGNVIPSIGGPLNRMENQGHLDARWTINPETVALVGFRFRQTDYTEDQLIGGNINDPIDFPLVTSQDRNNRLYSPYLGVDHTFRPDLTGSLRIGATYSDYYNDSTQSPNWSPYVMASLHYAYAVESYLEAGVSHDRNTTDVLGYTVNTVGGLSRATFTTDAESTVLFADVVHRFTPKIFVTLNGQYQNSTFNGGVFENDNEQYYLVGLDGEYRFTPNFSGHVGYNYDKLNSDVPGRTYDRNRVYIGVTGSY